MKPDEEFKERLDALVSSIGTGGRAQTERLIASVIDAGGISEGALLEIVHNRSLGTRLRLDICWLLPRLRITSAENSLKALMSDPSEQIREEAAIGLGLV